MKDDILVAHLNNHEAHESFFEDYGERVIVLQDPRQNGYATSTTLNYLYKMFKQRYEKEMKMTNKLNSMHMLNETTIQSIAEAPQGLIDAILVIQGDQDQYPNLNHDDMVRQLAKDGQQIIDTLTPEKAHKWHMVTGVAGEAGELLDAVKKEVAYNRVSDTANIIEELGDIEFYMAGVRQAYGLTRDQTLIANKNKLGKRYSGHQYSDKAAQDRADKK